MGSKGFCKIAVMSIKKNISLNKYNTFIMKKFNFLSISQKVANAQLRYLNIREIKLIL